MLTIDGCDTAIIGYVEDPSRVVYSYDLLVYEFTNQLGDRHAAIEWIDYNVLRGLPYLGEGAPLVLYPGGRDLIDEIADREEE